MNTAKDATSERYIISPELNGYQIIEPNLPYDIRWDSFSEIVKPKPRLFTKTRRILLAEDDEDQRKLIARVLMNNGFSVTEAENGEEAVEYALDYMEVGEIYDAVLMDLQLPKLDGYSAASTLRYRGYGKPIIAMTAKPIPEDEDTYLEAGCNYFLIKSQIHLSLIPTIIKCLDN